MTLIFKHNFVNLPLNNTQLTFLYKSKISLRKNVCYAYKFGSHSMKTRNHQTKEYKRLDKCKNIR